MTWRQYFQLANADRKSKLKPEHNFNLKQETNMFDISKLKNSRFLTKDDCGDGLVATIAGVREDNVAPEGDAPSDKWTLHFSEESIKPLVLNTTNGQIIAGICGAGTEDAWIGKQVEMYHDPNVSFAGKLTGGIRVRKPASVPTDANFSDDISF